MKGGGVENKKGHIVSDGVTKGLLLVEKIILVYFGSLPSIWTTLVIDLL